MARNTDTDTGNGERLWRFKIEDAEHNPIFTTCCGATYREAKTVARRVAKELGYAADAQISPASSF